MSNTTETKKKKPTQNQAAKKPTANKNGQKSKTSSAKKPTGTKTANVNKKPSTAKKPTQGNKTAAKKPTQGNKNASNQNAKPKQGQAKKGSVANKSTQATKKSTTTKKPTQGNKTVAKKPTQGNKVNSNKPKQGQANKKVAGGTQVKPSNQVEKQVSNKPIINEEITKVKDTKIVNQTEKEMINTQFMSKFKGYKTEKFNDDKKSSMATPIKKKKSKKVNSNKNNKKSFSLYAFLFTVCLVFIVGVSFLIYIFVASTNDGPVYGDRCISAIALDNSVMNDIVKEVKELDEVTDAKIEADCLTLKITLYFVDGIESELAKTIATDSLQSLDTALGRDLYEDSIYSEVFNMYKGENQYDVTFILISNENDAFPIFGQKHTSKDEISFTGADPANEDTTNALIGTNKDDTVIGGEDNEDE